MSLIHNDLATAIDAVAIQSAERYTILGELREVPIVDSSPASAERSSDRLVAMLSGDLYDRLYVNPSASSQAAVDVIARRDLLAALSAANSGRGTWEAGWTIRGVVDGQVIVSRDGIEFSVPLAGVRGWDDQIQQGTACRVWITKELRRLIPGFYLAIGDGEGDPDDAGRDAAPMLRYYWHLRSEAAVVFMATATSLLNEAAIPFRLKVLRDPDAYSRADAGVLYIPGRDPTTVASLVARIHSTVAEGLRPAIPLFTKRLAPGLGFADGVGLTQSFGQDRCRLVAEALWQSFAHGESDREHRIAGLARAFSQQGLDPLQPHRGPAWRPEYEPEPLIASGSAFASRAVETLAPATPMSSTTPLEAATRIARELCRSAYWDTDGRLCNWIGRSTPEADRMDWPTAPISRALRPDIYSGSAGIALFLAQLHALTGAEEYRRTALGGIRRSIRARAVPATEEPASPLSFFFGDLGIAYAAWRASTLVGGADLFLLVAPMIAGLEAAISVPHDRDVIGGNAGAIPFLLAMSRAPGFEMCLELAVVAGEELCRFDPLWSGVRCARSNREQVSDLEQFTPSGLSHGAAGIGLALLELHAATARRDFLDAARRAFDYEDTLFDADRNNWADLRHPSGHARYDLAWCNGAPGIALARLRAASLDPDRNQSYLHAARVGIGTTLDAIENHLAVRRYDATPCHGLAGLIEILWIAGRVLDDASYRSRATCTAQILIDRYSKSGDWPSGLYSGRPNPSLMLGTAGIGYTFLRLHDPERVPSVLWIGC